MSLVTTMYLIDIFQNLCVFIFTGTIIFLVIFAVLGILWLMFRSDNSDDLAAKLHPWLKRSFLISLVGGIFLIFMPSKATVYTFAGMKTLESFMATETGSQMTEDAKQILGDMKTIVHQYVIDLKTDKVVK